LFSVSIFPVLLSFFQQYANKVLPNKKVSGTFLYVKSWKKCAFDIFLQTRIVILVSRIYVCCKIYIAFFLKKEKTFLHKCLSY